MCVLLLYRNYYRYAKFGSWMVDLWILSCDSRPDPCLLPLILIIILVIVLVLVLVLVIDFIFVFVFVS